MNSSVRVQNSKVTEGYVLPQRIADGIFLGDALVTNNNGKACIYLTNTTEKDRSSSPSDNH